MTEILNEILERYGQEIEISNSTGAAASAKAFLQPSMDKAKAAPYAVTSLGTVDDRQWLCLCRTQLTAGDTVTGEGCRFTVQNSAPCYVGSELSHWWAVLSPQKEVAV